MTFDKEFTDLVLKQSHAMAALIHMEENEEDYDAVEIEFARIYLEDATKEINRYMTKVDGGPSIWKKLFKK